jgi:hypothetical protein
MTKIKEKTVLDFIDSEIEDYTRLKYRSEEGNGLIRVVICDAKIDILKEVKAFIEKGNNP